MQNLKLLTISLLMSSTAVMAADFCGELPIGDTHQVAVRHWESATGIPMTYALHRSGKNDYEVIINAKFKGANPTVEKRMVEKVSKCLQDSRKLTKRLKTSLSFKLYDEASDLDKIRVAPPVVEIEVSSIDRVHAYHYSPSISCKTIKHEVMHLLGLVDEYVEHGQYANRAIGPLNSIMNGPSGAPGDLFTSFRLYPAHVSSILYPNCLEKNEVYYDCAANAYKTKDLGERPEICGSKTEWLES